MKYVQLNEDEEGVLLEYEKGKLVPVPQEAREMRQYHDYVAETLNKTRNINVRISDKDLLKIKEKAIDAGIPYQTLVSSVLHRFANGKDRGI